MLLIPMVLKQPLQPAASQVPLLHPFLPVGKHTQGSLRSFWLPSMCSGNRAPLPEGRKKKIIHHRHLNYKFKKRMKILLWSLGEDQLRRIMKLKTVYFKYQLLSTHTISQSLCQVPVKCVLEFETAMWMNAGWNTKISWDSSEPLGE